MMRTSLLLVASVLVAGAVAQSCLPVGFGDYNVQAFTSYTGRNSDIEGSLFAGAFDLINYSVHSVASCPGDISLKANTGSWSNGQLKNGAGVLERQGAVSLSGVGLGANNVAAFAVPAVPAAVSAQLCALADDATVLQNSPYTGAVSITTGNAGFSVASVSLAQITQVSINRANPDDTVVINLRSATGAVEFLNSMVMIDGNANNDANAPYILFNACGVSDISVHSYGFWGSLLAPSSALTFYNGQFNGQVIVDSVDGLNGQYGEFHCIPFNGCVCPDGQCPNDPECTSNCDLLDTECDDYDCVDGNCAIVSSTQCDDSDLCNPQVCDDALGCILDTANVVTCDADTQCTSYSCNAATGQCESTDISNCASTDLCNPQVCDDTLGCILDTPVTCDADTQCTSYSCNAATGQCESTDISSCPSDTACTSYTCDDVDGCVGTPTTQCDNSDLCNPQVCDDTLGCILDTANVVTCDADTACTTYSCNAATGQCESTDISNCPADTACTSYSCDDVAGCVGTPTTQCDNSDLCNPQVCDDSFGCILDTANIVTCDADTQCTSYSCNAATGQCESTDISNCDNSDLCNPQVCDDTLGCILDTPNVVTCQDTFCYDYECVPALGTCEIQSSTVCDDSNVCTDDSCNDVTDQCDFVPNGTCGECVLEFGDEANFNVYSKSFLTLISDVEGPIAAAGQITASAFGVNAGPNDFTCDIGSSARAVVTAASASLSNGQVSGTVVVGNTCTGNACGAFTTTSVSPPNVDAPAIMSNLANINAVLCAQPNINTADFKVTNVFTAGNLGSQAVTVGAGQTVVINLHAATGFVGGQHTVNGQVANTFQAGQAGGRLLWNVCHSNNFQLTNYAFGGALLAPNSAVTATSASADGQLFTGSYSATNGGEAHCMKFTGCLCPYGVCQF